MDSFLLPPCRTRTGKRIGYGLNPNPGLSLTLDLLHERSADTLWNFGHELKKKERSTLQGGAGRDALEGQGPQRWPQRRFDRRWEEAAKAVGGGYCRLQMPLSLALSVRETVAGHRLRALEGGGGTPPPGSDASLGAGCPGRWS